MVLVVKGLLLWQVLLHLPDILKGLGNVRAARKWVMRLTSSREQHLPKQVAMPRNRKRNTVGGRVLIIGSEGDKGGWEQNQELAIGHRRKEQRRVEARNLVLCAQEMKVCSNQGILNGRSIEKECRDMEHVAQTKKDLLSKVASKLGGYTGKLMEEPLDFEQAPATDLVIKWLHGRMDQVMEFIQLNLEGGGVPVLGWPKEA